MNLAVDLDIVVTSRMPLKKWILNWTLSFATQAFLTRAIPMDLVGLQLIHVFSFATQNITKQPLYVSIWVTVVKLLIAAWQSLRSVHEPLRLLIGLGLSTLGYVEVNPMLQHQFAMVLFWTFCDSSLYKS